MGLMVYVPLALFYYKEAAMKIELTTMISALSLIIAIIVAVSNIRNKNYIHYRESASQVTTLIVKLENIADGINEIKADMRSMKTDVDDMRERLIKVEQSAKIAHKRIDTIEGVHHGNKLESTNQE